MALVFDIETVGEEWDTLDEATQSALTRWIKRESRTEEEYRIALADMQLGLGLSPLTGSIVAIGVYDTDTKKGAVYFSTSGKKVKESEENGPAGSGARIKYRPMEEKEMLEQFWTVAQACKEFVSFNGRAFDAPFLVIRSVAHKVKPTRDLLQGRYLYQQRDCLHIDLQDQLTFYGAWNKKPSLHLFCRAFGIKSPKAQGTTGDDVALLYQEEKYEDIAHYNAGDLIATAALYERWRETLR